MVELATSVQALARHYGVRVTYRACGRPLVDVSQPCDLGHAVAPRPGAVAAKMIRFRGDRILFSAILDSQGRLVSIPHWSATVIQRAYRRRLAMAEPFLPMPPLAAAAARTGRAPWQ